MTIEKSFSCTHTKRSRSSTSTWFTTRTSGRYPRCSTSTTRPSSVSSAPIDNRARSWSYCQDTPSCSFWNIAPNTWRAKSFTKSIGRLWSLEGTYSWLKRRKTTGRLRIKKLQRPRDNSPWAGKHRARRLANQGATSCCFTVMTMNLTSKSDRAHFWSRTMTTDGKSAKVSTPRSTSPMSGRRSKSRGTTSMVPWRLPKVPIRTSSSVASSPTSICPWWETHGRIHRKIYWSFQFHRLAVFWFNEH